MSKIDDFRAKYPGVYDDMSDAEIADALYQKSYSDMDRGEFDKAMGLQPGPTDIMATAPAPMRFLDDMTNVSMDAFTRGFGGRHDAVRGSRARLPGWAEVPADIAGSVVGSPYRVGSKLLAAGVGGLEGAADAYGHQDSWVPDPWTIGKGAVMGSGLGYAGAKIGEMGGALLDRFRAKKGETFKSSGDLSAEATRRKDLGYTQFAEDFKKRADRVAQVEAAQGADRGTVNTMLKGMDLSPVERQAADAITSKTPGILGKGIAAAGKVAEPFSLTKKGGLGMLAADFLLGGHGVPTTASAVATGLSALGKRASRPSSREIDDLLALMRDPSGKGYRVDPVGANAARDLLAKLGIGGSKNLQ